VTPPLRLFGLHGLPEVRPGDDLAALILAALDRGGEEGTGRLRPGDVVVVTQKIVSKAEGRLVDLATVEPSPFAVQAARASGKDPRYLEVVLRETRRIVRMDRGVLICETHHGFVCANAGVDESNVAGGGVVALLPVDPDASAARMRAALEAATGVPLAVIITDTFGRAWREGLTNVAIGVSGLVPLRDHAGQRDPYGYLLKVSALALADEVAAAAELVMGKVDRVPVAVMRGLSYQRSEDATARPLLRAPERDLFR